MCGWPLRKWNDAPYILHMSDLMRYAGQLDEISKDGQLPPVDRWDPPFCGNLDLIIKSDGTWIHEGTPIGRARLVRLFSTVLKKEDEKFFLVTPVEKLGIIVEDAPFLAVSLTQSMQGDVELLTFKTNVGDTAVAGQDHKIEYRKRLGGEDSAPYIHVRAGLEAKIARPVFYDMINLAQTRMVDGVEMFGVTSEGIFFEFCRASDLSMEAGQ